MKHGIWKHSQLVDFFEAVDYLSLDEGHTPLETIIVGNLTIDIKREDRNPTGSYKDRSSALKVTQLRFKNVPAAVIASSGNAAISMLKYGGEFDIEVYVVVSPNANPEKLKLIDELVAEYNHPPAIRDVYAKRRAARLSATEKIPNLKAAIDSEIKYSYQSIAWELEKQLEYDDVFMPVSSGTAFSGFSISMPMSRMHAVQTTRVCPLASEYDTDFVPEETHLADSIVDKSMLRKPEAKKFLDSSNGSGWVISNAELRSAAEKVNHLLTSPLSYTSLLSVAAALRAHEQDPQVNNVLCIASGR